MAPPSRHISGKNYSWKIEPNTTPLAPVPKWFLEIIKKEEEKDKYETVIIGKVIPKGQRVKVLRSLTGSMRWRGMNEPAILAALEAINQTQCEESLPDSKIKDIARSYGKYLPGEITSKAATAKEIPLKPKLPFSELHFVTGR